MGGRASLNSPNEHTSNKQACASQALPKVNVEFGAKRATQKIKKGTAASASPLLLGPAWAARSLVMARRQRSSPSTSKGGVNRAHFGSAERDLTPKPAPRSLKSSIWNLYSPSASPPNYSINLTVLQRDANSPERVASYRRTASTAACDLFSPLGIRISSALPEVWLCLESLSVGNRY